MNKLMIIKNPSGQELQRCIFTDQKVLDAFINLLNTQCPWGKPERWIAASRLQEGDISVEEETREIFPSAEREVLEDEIDEETGTVLHLKGETVVVPAVLEVFHKLPAEFEVVVEDYITPYHELRRAEYVKIDEMKNEAMVELLAEGRSEKMEEYKALRAAIKLKIPRS